MVVNDLWNLPNIIKWIFTDIKYYKKQQLLWN